MSQTLPNLAVSSEIRLVHARALADEQTTLVAALRIHYGQKMQATEELALQVNDAEKIHFERQAVITPITRISPDVLSVIFTAHTLTNHESPWVLMHVCRLWRATALVTKRIWIRIMLVSANLAKSEDFDGDGRTCYGMEVCYERSQLDRALQRAGNAPLDIEVKMPYASSDNMELDDETDEMNLLTLVEILSKHRGGPRLCSLVIDTWYRLNIPPELFHAFDFSELTVFGDSDARPELVDKLAREAGRLIDLDLPTQSLVKFGERKRCVNIEELVVRDPLFPHDIVNIRSILLDATRLTVLELIDGRLQDEVSPNRIHLPSLKRLEMSGFRDFWPIHCPNLTHLFMSQLPPAPQDLEAGSIHLPKLIELGYTESEAVVNDLVYFHVPSLWNFSLNLNASKSEHATFLEALWPASEPQTNIEPRILSIDGSKINEKLLASTLSARRLLEEIRISQGEITPAFLVALTPVPINRLSNTSTTDLITSSGKWRVCCATLKRLFIDLNGHRVKDRDEFVVAAQDLITARAAAALPLERFAVRFMWEENWSQGWQELLEGNNAA